MTHLSDATMQALLATRPMQTGFLLRKGEHFDDPSTAPLQWEHARNMFTLMRDGKLLHVSALMTGADVVGFGILATESADEAAEILSQDPGVKAGRLSFEIVKTISFDAGQVRIGE